MHLICSHTHLYLQSYMCIYICVYVYIYAWHAFDVKWGVWGWHLQCLYALHCIKGAISQRLNVVIVKRQQAEAVQIAKGILAYAGDFIGIQQEKLQWCKSFKYAWGQILYFIAIEHARKKNKRTEKTLKNLYM